MKEQFRYKKFQKKIGITLSNGKAWAVDTWGLLDSITSIIESYHQKNIQMTLRQLYYQLVAADIIPNDDRVYKKLSSLLTDSRYLGLVDWEAIEDRVRIPHIPSEWKSIKDIVKTAIYSFRLPRWENQEYYVELFTEKDALSSILYPITQKFHVPFCVNRGYSSATAMYDLYKRVSSNIEVGKAVVVLYLGDHDPSGLDMVRDIKERITEFIRVKGIDLNFEVKPIALTKGQILKYNPPPNPAKISDPRAKWYLKEFGPQSWEVDALKPDVMISLVEESIQEYINPKKWDKVLQDEKWQRNKLEKILAETSWE